MNASREELTEESLFDKRVLKKECISESEEWVVESPSMEGNIFSHFSLTNFLTYDLNCIPKVTLMNFAIALKLKVLDKIMEFEPPYREQLQVLCKITDGNQTERNQNIITKRMLTILNKQEINSKHSSKLFNSQNTVSQEELTYDFSEVQSFFAASEANKNDVHEYVDEWDCEACTCQKPSTKSTDTANEPKEQLTIKSLSSNGAYQEATIKDKSSENTADKHTLSNRAAPHTNNCINAFEEEWNLTSPVKSNSYSEFGENSKFYYNYSDEEWAITYPAKEEISKENTDGKEQKCFLASGCISSGKNKNSNSKERRTETSNFAGRSMRKFFSDIRNEPGSNRGNGWKQAVKTEEFIPDKMKKLPSQVDTCLSHVDSSTFGYFSLTDLLKYDMDRMSSDELKNYASALKLRVLDKIFEFEPSYKEELEVLCDITDGNQTDRNQKIICSRICAIVNKTIPSKLQWN